MQQKRRRDRLKIAALTASIVTAMPAIALAQYEPAPSFHAKEVVPRELLSSPYYEIADRVTLRDYQYVFSLQTRWGRFEVQGTELLRLRAKEMAATAQLEKVSGEETTLEAASRTALRPLSTVRGLLTDPEETISNTVKGVRKTAESVEAGIEATDPNRERPLAAISGGAQARRNLAYDLGVDPYTSFPPLDDQLTRLATASALGQVSVQAGSMFIPGAVGLPLSVGSASETLRQNLRDKTAGELERDGRQSLTAMGVPEATQDAFYRNPSLTPTDKEVVVEALRNMKGPEGSADLIAQAAGARSPQWGYIYRQQAILMASYSAKVAPIRRFAELGSWPAMETSRGTIAMFPADYLFWSRPIEQNIEAANANRPEGPAELGLIGQTSRRAAAELSSLGWEVIPDIGPRLGLKP
ncbi:hypothetical protein V6C03_00400 [Methyloligella sp. 2.7D]|uniref:hypothetical protein n=1 Tax=unclassified Methyloligella TaxID=2625955 RepID=UPI00157D3BD6|nr:hypothetical protein [Methyloligella sp. GL2]QKP76867.1 hypothetical protein HT051_05010 [Methyloligella sp. GL2]